ncbi:MAG: hypothetical protein HWE39_13930 [Oceanospirillaceae bacterium]|nr:hypothetical protein [Oceanospirillaceae bacterium]
MKRLINTLRSLFGCDSEPVEHLDVRVRRDIGLDAMSAQYLRDERLWRELAA